VCKFLAQMGIGNSPEYDCGAKKQAINHIAFECPSRFYHGPGIYCLTTPHLFNDWRN